VSCVLLEYRTKAFGLVGFICVSSVAFWGMVDQLFFFWIVAYVHSQFCGISNVITIPLGR
jgi:uncharacterized membrane protein